MRLTKKAKLLSVMTMSSLIFLGLFQNVGLAKKTQIQNNTQWRDEKNNRIQARGGHILDNRNADAKFYFYGASDPICEDSNSVTADVYENSPSDANFRDSITYLFNQSVASFTLADTGITILANGSGSTENVTYNDKNYVVKYHCQLKSKTVNAYHSTDLINWKKVDNFQVLDNLDAKVADVMRPNVLFNKKTKKYIMFIKGKKIYSSDSPKGPFKEAGTLDFPKTDGIISIDAISAYQEKRNSTDAYLAVRGGDKNGNTNHRIAIYKLDSNFTALVTPNKAIYIDLTYNLEAPGLFIREDNNVKSYYLVASRTNGWGPSNTYYKKALTGFAYFTKNNTDASITADSQLSTWGKIDSENTTVKPKFSFQTQFDFIINLGNDNFMFGGDRWSDISLIGTRYDYIYADKNLLKGSIPVNKNSHYHWSPISFSIDGKPQFKNSINWTPSIE